MCALHLIPTSFIISRSAQYRDQSRWINQQLVMGVSREQIEGMISQNSDEVTINTYKIIICHATHSFLQRRN